MNLQTPLRSVLRTTDDHLTALEGMDIRTVQDLLLYFPRSHEDLRSVMTLRSAPLDEKITLKGSIGELKVTRIRGGKYLIKTIFTDLEGDTAEVVWFNQPHIKRMLPDGSEVMLTGKLLEERYSLKLNSPQFELLSQQRSPVHAGRLVPVYPQHDIITTKWMREKMLLVRDAIAELPETLPAAVVEREELLPRSAAVEALHSPDDPEVLAKAQQRMAFEVMYESQTEALQRRKQWQGEERQELSIPMDPTLIRALFASLQFQPTNSQKVAIYEILKDMERPVPMSRLLEGDVGSGKTLVALAVMANVLTSGGQCALMVPTEVLARQHAATISRMLLAFHTYLSEQGTQVFPNIPRVSLLAGSLTAKEAQSVRDAAGDGMVDIVVGTHALIEDSVRFRRLSLVIIDEQHRFGVQQRERLAQKGNPHVLAMTATPIPRTLALTAYGEHDLSVLLEKPGNRQVIDTKVVPPKDRQTVEHFIDHQIAEGRQVFVICPLIETSESEEVRDIKSVDAESERLRDVFPHRRIAVLHGRMQAQEKEAIMTAFRNHDTDILVSTSVIEVGIDVPNASMILIEGAERFGLSQLHQFRGRVGRGEHKSYCFLFPTLDTQAKSPRLKAMEQYDSGFQLAEIDLQLRGPGELFGLRQSGVAAMFWSAYADPELVIRARKAAATHLGISVALPSA